LDYYNQCTLEKDIIPGRMLVRQVSWIPTKYASLGRVVKLKNDHGEWEDGWKVVSVGDKTPENIIPDAHDGVKAHRKATGDSIRKEK
jgi:hypothetical protein